MCALQWLVVVTVTSAKMKMCDNSISITLMTSRILLLRNPLQNGNFLESLLTFCSRFFNTQGSNKIRTYFLCLLNSNDSLFASSNH